MDACECSGGARAGSLRPERHTRKPRAPYRAAGKCRSQRSRNPVRGKEGKGWEKEWGKKEFLSVWLAVGMWFILMANQAA
ncbi:hypothetical protein NDU88_003345 [Pleurodeles waltl]|uniref:Uncharacterized protein n=1 Tax=Pleurodeles waltl TaxID=8319 RepID=A0AAV7QBV3_PLEWA|nr:hypothetical protein NDU88_003345 [Pleurodeles waltl]